MEVKNTSKSLKPALKRLIDELPENKVEELISYLVNQEKGKESKINILRHLESILETDSELLKRLAR
jgi:hypothetical protein